MDGIEKITARIRADADAELSQLREQTEAQILEIQTQSKTQADQERTAILARGRRAAEERLERLEGRIQELGMRPEDYWWYLDLRRYGGCKHAGFGLGFERMVMYLTGISNIRDVLPHPRTVGNAEF